MVENESLGADSTAVQKHLELVQGVITRMAENCRSCKVWCVTLVAAILVLVARTGKAEHALIALAPAILFYLLDAYYLGLERRYINSYNDFVRKFQNGQISVSDLFIVAPIGSVPGQLLWAMFRSFSILPFYIVLVATVVLVWRLIL